MTTLREHLDRAIWFAQMGRTASAVQEMQAALAILDAADKEWVKGSVIPPGRLPGWWRLVPDPEPPAPSPNQEGIV